MMEAALQPAPPPAAAPAAGGEPLLPEQLLYLARGFARVFWGLLAALLLGALLFWGGAFVELHAFVRVPAYVFGLALICWGLHGLRDAEPVSAAWPGRVRWALRGSWLGIYFAPFVGWCWTRPEEAYFLANVLALLTVGALLLLALNVLLVELYRRLGDRAGRIEAQMFAGGVLFLMVAPLIGWMAVVAGRAVWHHTALGLEARMALQHVPAWIYAYITVPCSLTLLAAWKARDRCYQELWRAARPAFSER